LSRRRPHRPPALQQARDGRTHPRRAQAEAGAAVKCVRAALLAALLLIAACGSSQSSDVKTVADAVAAADSQGMGFNVTLTIVFTGGTIPKGRAEQVKAQGTGV